MNNDTTIFEMDGRGYDRLEKAIQLAVEDHTAISWKQDPKRGLIFSWGKADVKGNGLTAFPAPMGAKNISMIAWAYLSTIKTYQDAEKIIGHYPNIDGSVEMGWHLSLECGDSYGMISVQVCWILYGK